MLWKVTLRLAVDWALANAEGDTPVGERFAESVRAAIGPVSSVETAFMGCVFTVERDMGAEQLTAALRSLAAIVLGEPDIEGCGELTVAPAPEAPPAPSPSGAVSAIERIRALAGADDFKTMAEELVLVAPQVTRHNAGRVFTFQNYLFAIDSGYGLTTVLGLLADLLTECGLYSFASRSCVTEYKLPVESRDQSAPLEKAISDIRDMTRRSLVCLDISEWLPRLQETEFGAFLSKLTAIEEEFIFVFRVPFLDRSALADVEAALEDVLYMRTVEFVPLDAAELRACAKQQLDGLGFSFGHAAWDVFDARIAEEKNEGRFYGVNTVRKVVNEMVYRKLLYNARTGSDDALVAGVEVEGLWHSLAGGKRSGQSLLDELVGVERIKRRVNEIVAQMELALARADVETPTLHMRFVGSPGTGKTTVARILGRILKDRGILRVGAFYEVNGRDLCGSYIGQTAFRTAAKCRDAYGSVLFIDEAYSLNDGREDSGDYGREAIATLVSEMENHRTDMVVIMAGYPDEMERLVRVNPGLESRMPYVVEFPNYTREELLAIFLAMVGSRFDADASFGEAARAFFEGLPDELLQAKDFANARFVRNLYERTWGKAVMRQQLGKDGKLTLTGGDLEAAAAEGEFRRCTERRSARRLGF